MYARIGKSKKGMSLVELIAVMAISVVVVGAALLALYGGSRSATDGSADFANHGDAHLLETWLRDNLPTAGNAVVSDTAGGAYSLFFTSDGNFEIAKAGKSIMQISGIQSFTVSTKNAGADQTFQYTITAAGGGRSFALSGGTVLNNVPAAVSDSALTIPSETTLIPSDAGKKFVNIAAG